MKKSLVLICVMMCGIVVQATSETLTVGLHLPDRRPFFWMDEQQQQHGIYVELLQEIGTAIGVDMQFSYLPQARIVKDFLYGKLDIEPGIAPAWRPASEDQATSLYSVPFIQLDDVLIFPPGKAITGIATFDDLQKLKGLHVAQVRGFYVPEGITAVDADHELMIARMVDKARVDAGFMNAMVASFYQRTQGLQYEISAPFASTPVSLRLHKNQARWLEPINQAILQFQQDGTLQAIVDSYLSGTD